MSDATKYEGNVPSCAHCTRVDAGTGDRFRVRDCRRVCHIMREAEGPFPLTLFLVNLMKLADSEPKKLKTADPDKLAEKYGISPAHAAGYLNMARELKGITV